MSSILLSTDFEEPFKPYLGISEVKLPPGATAIWREGTPEETGNGYLKRPEFYQEYRGIEGRAAAFGHRSATYNAAIVYRVPVLRGSTITARVLARPSTERAGLGMHLCIEPFAGDFYGSEYAVSSRYWGHYEKDWVPNIWQPLEVSAIAQEPYVSVVLHCQVDYRVSSYALWDRLEVVAEGGADIPVGWKAEVIKELNAINAATGRVRALLDNK